MKLRSRFSLTTSMLIVTLIVGVILWAASDLYQSHQLRSIFHQNLETRFKNQATEDRVRFNRYINSYDPAVRVYANSIRAINYIKSDQWKKNIADKLVLHEQVPAWLPKISIMRSYVWPRYAMLLDRHGKLRELYHYLNPIPPEGLLNISRHSLELGIGQSFIISIDGQPYVMSAAHINHNDDGPILLITSPIDSELLKKSLGGDADKSIIALLKGGEQSTHVNSNEKILVSSNEKLVPKNTKLGEIESRYYVTGADHFETGSSDVLLKFISFISTDEVNHQTEAIISADRKVTALSAIVFIIAFALVVFRITSRIQKLTSRVVGFSEDMEIAQPKLEHANQIDELENRFELLASAIRKETEALEHQALHDTLTELPNRKMFNDMLQRQLEDNADIDHHFIILLIDLDRFKEINDTLGHHIGDEVLKIAAQRLQHVHRNNDLVARLGGDEFGILLPDTSIARATLLVDKILEIFSQPLVVEGHNLEMGLSIGIAEFPTHGYDANILLQRADVAMYNAKHKRTGYAIYESVEDRHTVGRLALMSELRQAMSQEALSVYYQPKIDLKTGKICGAEALLRWEHAQRGFIAPSEFIPLAEQTGLIQQLTYWVLEQAAIQCALWRDRGSLLAVSVNVSVNCIHDILLPEKLQEIITRYGLKPSQFIIELTENVFMKDPVNSLKVLNKIDRMGVEISIDDFGTGYSSLSYLKQLPVKEIKIDRSFVMDMLIEENNAVIVRTTADLARNLGMRVIAEGVESREVEEALRLICDAAQGFYYSPPVTAEEFLALLSNPARLKLRCV